MHSILKITLPRYNEEWVLDLTCSQYGWSNLIQPWSSYVFHKVDSSDELKFFDFGWMKQEYETRFYRNAYDQFIRQSCKEFANGIVRWAHQAAGQENPERFDEDSIETSDLLSHAFRTLLANATPPAGYDERSMIDTAKDFMVSRLPSIVGKINREGFPWKY